VRPATVALRDQILAVLRDADGFPMATWAIAEATTPGPGATPMWNQEVYRQLYALERKGLVGKTRMPGWRSVFWSAVWSASHGGGTP
jgi:Fe2+ or Zn2+ uptake regulation protein